MSKYFFDFRPDFNLFNPDTKRATTIYYTVVYFILKSATALIR